jgi:hypothetical protein
MEEINSILYDMHGTAHVILIAALFVISTDGLWPSLFQLDAGTGDCACSAPGFLLSTAADITVITSPTGNGSMNVIAALVSGLS